MTSSAKILTVFHKLKNSPANTYTIHFLRKLDHLEDRADGYALEVIFLGPNNNMVKQVAVFFDGLGREISNDNDTDEDQLGVSSIERVPLDWLISELNKGIPLEHQKYAALAKLTPQEQELLGLAGYDIFEPRVVL